MISDPPCYSADHHTTDRQAQLGRGPFDGCYRFPVRQSDKHHVTGKPTPLMEELVRVVPEAGGLVLDPFMGSATTGVACLRAGLRFLGVEQSKEIFETAVERLRQEAATLPRARCRDGAKRRPRRAASGCARS